MDIARFFIPIIAGSWQTVSAPDAAFNWLPFTIQKSGASKFRISPSFNLETYANIAVAKTYYVDRAMPDDTGNGLTWATAFQKLGTALAKADVDRIYIAEGVYEYGYGWDGYDCARSVKVIGIGNVVLAPHATLSWSAVDSHYEAVATGGTLVLDLTNIDSFGDYQMLVKKTSSADVDATAGSWYYASNVFYVHTFDDRAPDANIWTYQAVNNGLSYKAKTFYLENLKFYGVGWTHFINNADGKTYAKNCEFKYPGATGNGFLFMAGESIVQNCLASRSYQGDGFHCNERAAGVGSNFAMIDCISHNHGDATKNNCNGYSSHGAQVVTAINCNFTDSYGPSWKNAADVGLPKEWALGCLLRDPIGQIAATDVNYSTIGTGWLDGCTSIGAVTDLEVGAGGAIYYRNLNSGGVFIGAPVPY